MKQLTNHNVVVVHACHLEAIKTMSSP